MHNNSYIMFSILIIIGIIYLIAKVSSPNFWSGWCPPRYKPYHGKGLPWFGNGKRKHREHIKYYWDD